MPRMPATKTKSPARAPRLQVPVGAMAPAGDKNLDPAGSRHHASGAAGLQRERVQHAAHLALERLVDELVLLHPRLALERGRQSRSRHSGRRRRRDRGSSPAASGMRALISRSISPASIAMVDSPQRSGLRQLAGHVGRQPAFEPLAQASRPGWGARPASVNASPPVVPSRRTGTPAARARAEHGLGLRRPAR